jgi:hypothetical protein
LRGFVVISLRGRTMKIILGLLAIWLLSGVIAAGLIAQVRPPTMSEIQLGPITLFRIIVG